MIYLRTATDADMAIVLAWRNNPDVYNLTYSQRKPLSWSIHKVWWQSREDWVKLMVCLIDEDLVERPVGILNISPLCYWSPEIGITIGETSLWGNGVGAEAFALGCVWLRDKGYGYTSTTVLRDNDRMRGILEKLSFEMDGYGRDNEIRYSKKL